MKLKRERLATESELDTVTLDQVKFVPSPSGEWVIPAPIRTLTLRQMMQENPGYKPLVTEYVEPSLAAVLNMPGAQE